MLLARGLAQRGHEISVLSFYDESRVVDGVRIVGLGKRGRLDTVAFFARLLTALRALRPDVLHGYLPMANMVAALARPAVPGLRVIFGVRATEVDFSRYDRLSVAAYRAERLLVRMASLVICNSEAARAASIEAGFPRTRLKVIHNGIDATHFRPDRAAGLRARRALGVEPEALLIGHVGRLDPMKDHETFFAALLRLMPALASVRVLVVGDGPEELRAKLIGRAETLGLAKRIIWTARQDEMPSAYNALDVMCLSSAFGESFPNVIGEAMACGVPCVATDIGDVREVIGDTGRVIRPQDPDALAVALREILALDSQERHVLGARAQARIADRFSVDRMIAETEASLAGLLANGRQE